MKNQVKNKCKKENDVNNKKSKTSKYNFSNDSKEKGYNMLEIMIQTSLFPLLNIIITKVGTRVSNLSHFWSGDNLVKFRNIKSPLGYL